MSHLFTLKNSLVVLGAFIAGYLGLQLMGSILYAVGQPDIGLWGGVMVYGAIFEELLKFVIALGIYRLCRLPAVAVMVGLGYGFGERLLYWTASGTLIPHDFAALGMHVAAGLSSAYFLSKYKITSSRRDLALALIAPILVHGAYNTALWVWYQWLLMGL